MSKLAPLVLVLAIAAYGLSLFLPGIVYRKQPYRELRHFGRAEAVLLVKNGTDCHDVVGRPLDPGASHNNASAAAVSYECSVPSDKRTVEPGWGVLALGWLGVLIGNIAWYGNVLGLCASIVGQSKYSRRLAAALSFMGFVVGLDALAPKGVPEGEGLEPNRLVDHLGTGYYVWEVALLALALSQLLYYWDQRRQHDAEAAADAPKDFT